MTTFTWNGLPTGAWSDTRNWTDLSEPDSVATRVPGAGDSVLIGGPTVGSIDITGPGAAADVTLLGQVTLDGSLSVGGALTLGDADGYMCTLDIGIGSTVTAGTVLAHGNSEIGLDGAQLDVSGAMTLDSRVGDGITLGVGDLATVQVGTLTLLGDNSPSSGADNDADIDISKTGSLSVGAPTGPTILGDVTVNPGATLSGAGFFVDYPFVTTLIDDGTVIASGGSLLVGDVTGTGIVQVADDATFWQPVDPDLPDGAANPNSLNTDVAMTGTDATLALAGTLGGTISGFAVGDVLLLGTLDAVGVGFAAAGAGGTLTLTSAAGATQSIALDGDFSGDTFYLLPATPDVSSAVVLVANGAASGPSAGTASNDTYEWVGGDGAWGDVANWRDDATGAQPAAVAPGPVDNVGIAGSAESSPTQPPDLVTGYGAAGTLTIYQGVALGGIFTATTLLLDDSSDVSELVATGVGTSVTVTGDAVVGGATLAAVAGASIKVGYVTMTDGQLSTGGGGTIEIGAPAGGALAAGIDIDPGATLSASGITEGSIVDNGLIDVSGDMSFNGTSQILGDGAISLEADADVLLPVQLVTPEIIFAGSDAVLTLTGNGDGRTFPPTALTGPISGFASGDTIDLGYIATGKTWNPTGADSGVLTIQATWLNAQGSVYPVTQQLTFEGNYTASDFAFTEALGTGLVLTAGVPCFAAGARLLTTEGEVVVEALQVGAWLPTLLGGLRRVVWIGHRHIDCRHHPRPELIMPVRVASDAFGPGLPRRDLLLSPDHAVFVDRVLIPVRLLVNGATIARHDVETVTYYHVELDTHDVILAEGLPCESYLDTGNRGAFVNGGETVHLHPDFAPRAWHETCAPMVLDGPALAAARARLLQQAGRLGRRRRRAPAPRLLVGDVLRRPIARDGNRYTFRIPPGATQVRLCSGTGTPAQLLAQSWDHRVLGLSVDRIAVHDASGSRLIPLDDPALGEGWHELERDGDYVWRWTDGDGHLAVSGGGRLQITIAGWLPLWARPPGALAA